MKPLILVGMLAGVWAAFLVMEFHDKGTVRLDLGFWGAILLHLFLLSVIAIGLWHAKRHGKFLTTDGLGVVVAIVLSYAVFFIGSLCYL